MDERFERKKRYRIIRRYTDSEKKTDYDVFLNLTEDVKRITGIITRHIVEGVSSSKFVVIVETANKVVVEYWEGQRDDVTGIMQSKRQFSKQADYEIGHLFVQEIIQNAQVTPYGSKYIVPMAQKLIDFALMEYKKSEKTI